MIFRWWSQRFQRLDLASVQIQVQSLEKNCATLDLRSLGRAANRRRAPQATRGQDHSQTLRRSAVTGKDWKRKCCSLKNAPNVAFKDSAFMARQRLENRSDRVIVKLSHISDICP